MSDLISNTHQPVNILMVDDQPGKLLSYEAILGPLGENLLKASSGWEALEHLLKNEIAVILMDVSMPDMDGFQLAAMIREHPRFQKIAIIFISGVHLTDTDKLRGYERGAVDYISVPVIPDVLRAKVSVFAELHRKTRELEQLNRELEQRVAERTSELMESETQFRSLANSIPQLAWMADASGSIFWYNQRWYEYTGTTLELVKGWGWKIVHHPAHLERVSTKFRLAVQSGTDWEDTFPLRGADGSYRWFLSRATPILDAGGKIARWFGTNTDITDQRQSEQALAEQARLLDLTSDAIFIWNAEDRIVYWNTGATKLYGFTREEADGMPIHELLRTEFPEPLSMINKQVRESGSWSGELVHARKDGTQVVVESRWVLDPNSRDTSLTVMQTNTDITERKQNQQTLAERGQLLDLSNDAIIIRSAEDKILYWNRGAAQMYGYSREESVGKVIHELLNTEFSEPLEKIREKLHESGNWSGELVHSRKDGTTLVVASRWVMDRSLRGGMFSIMETNTDITDRKRAEDALVKSERLAAMGRLAGIIAHEINNPLEAISNAFYLLHDHPSLDEEARYYSRLAQEELLRLTHITKQTLSFYRESQQPVPLAISDILDNVVELQARKLQLNRIVLERDFRTTGRIQGFSVELRQVFLNIISNAIQAMPEGGRLRLRLTESRSRNGHSGVRVDVSDTGIGIKAEHASRIFEPFFSTKDAKGTGLGLWISRGIIQKYGGGIRFRTKRFKSGSATCFSIFIPGIAVDEREPLVTALSA